MYRTEVPKSAVILAAGMGSRLRPLTDFRPKPLVEVLGVSIIHNALRHLGTMGVRSVTIVVGYRKDAIEYACGERFAGVDIDYVESTVYDRTGSAYSLWLARHTLLSGDIFLLEGDVFFERQALVSLMAAGAGDAAAVAPFTEEMEGSAVVLGAGGTIAEVRMKQTAADLNQIGGPSLFKTLNLFRFSRATLSTLIVPALDDLIGTGAGTTYTEQVLAQLIARGLKITAARCDTVKWYEIDNQADLRMAENLFAAPPDMPVFSQAV